MWTRNRMYDYSKENIKIVALSVEETYIRYDIPKAMWNILSLHLSGQPGKWGRVAKDNRKFLNGVFWTLRTAFPMNVV
jgi:hypothetical protein